MARMAIASSCKFCGKPGMQWTRVINRYGRTSSRQIEMATGQVHQCDEYWKNRKRNEPAFNEPKETPDEPEKPFDNPFVPKPKPEPEVIPEPIPEPVEPDSEPIAPIVPVWDGNHEFFGELLTYIKARENVFIAGPAGSGKTYSAELVAKHLGLSFYPISVGPQTSKADLIGYMDAHGKLVRTAVRNAFEFGGVLLLDELDAGNGGVLTVLNALLANDVCGFPDSTPERPTITKHENFRCIAGANTVGQGPNRQYSGRQKLDDATLDRFVMIDDWDYDRRLEAKLGASQMDWTRYIWSLRESADRQGILRIFGTRKIQKGANLLNHGVALETVKKRVAFGGIGIDERNKLESLLPRR